MGKSQQQKGRRGEREICSILQSYGFNAQAGEALNFGSQPDVSGLEGVHLEIKRVERLNLMNAMRQAINDSARFQDGVPVVMHRANRQPWLCSMLLSDWIQFYSAYQSSKQ